MQRALVTGGCGFLGSWVSRQLLDEGVDVRVLAAPGEPRDNLAGVEGGIEVLEGDVRDPAVARRAVEGRDTVLHLAAVYRDFAPDPWRMYDVNLRGTFHVLEASRRAGVARVVYTASVVSIGRPPPGQHADESAPYECWDLDFPYSRSKLFSRELAEYFAEWGLDVRVVCPGVVLGPDDLRPTPSGQLIVNALTPGLPALHFPGGASYVDVRDAARVHLLAATRGEPGERYIATAHNLSNEELVDAIQQAAGVRKPKVRLPLPVARSLARAMDVAARRTGAPPLLSREFFEYSLRPSYYRNDKARRALGARFRPLDETLRDAVADFRERGLVRAA